MEEEESVGEIFRRSYKSLTSKSYPPTKNVTKDATTTPKISSYGFSVNDSYTR